MILDALKVAVVLTVSILAIFAAIHWMNVALF